MPRPYAKGLFHSRILCKVANMTISLRVIGGDGDGSDLGRCSGISRVDKGLGVVLEVRIECLAKRG